MRQFGLVGILLLAFVLPAHAQGTTPRAEIFGGYSYLRNDVGTDEDFGNDEFQNFHGFGFSFAGNLWGNLGVVADVSLHHKEIFEVDVRVQTFLFGPRFYVRRDRMTGFVHGLVGIQRGEAEIFDLDESETGVAFGFGGGLDVNVGERIAIRAVQFDYIPNRFSDTWFHSWRYQAGVVVKLGGG